ncbi:nitrite reductase (NAD(P)H) small subunit [Streptomyces sp. NPDC046465]|uniref:nitrite reductase (NAD(P)H) small subunit n=1 Tax=Streptomyces sp. NPDC046465 TaxID=3155810 RepID=UPI00340ABB22
MEKHGLGGEDIVVGKPVVGKLFRLVDRFLMYYLRAGERLERTAPWFERIGGLDHLISVLIDDSLGICAEPEAQKDRHAAAYRDAWQAVLADPQALSRFEQQLAKPSPEFLEPGHGRAAVLPDGSEAALFKGGAGRVYAVGSRDPFSGADVIAHGILGIREGRPVVASPMHKQEFDLRTGRCLDDPSFTSPAHEVRSVLGPAAGA